MTIKATTKMMMPMAANTAALTRLCNRFWKSITFLQCSDGRNCKSNDKTRDCRGLISARCWSCPQRRTTSHETERWQKAPILQAHRLNKIYESSSSLLELCVMDCKMPPDAWSLSCQRM